MFKKLDKSNSKRIELDEFTVLLTQFIDDHDHKSTKESKQLTPKQLKQKATELATQWLHQVAPFGARRGIDADQFVQLWQRSFKVYI